MGRWAVKLPDIGEGTTEAEIVAWHVAPGDLVREEDPLVDVMTEKATVEIPAPVSGTVLSLGGAVGDKLAVGSALAVLEVAGEGNLAGNGAPLPEPAVLLSPARPAAAGPMAAPPVTSARPLPPAPSSRASQLPAPRALASPAVRRHAKDLGIDLQRVAGTGPHGRVTQPDLDAFVAARASPAAAQGAARPAPRDGIEDVAIVGLRRTIAERLQEAARRIPHFTYVEEVDVTALDELREHLNHPSEGPEGRAHLTLLPFLMRAIVGAIAAHPQVNARFDDEAGVLHRYEAVHIGVATQTAAGLMVPVVRHAEALDLWQAAAEIVRLAAAARAGKIALQELAGSTITITSLGALGGLASTPVINRPEVAIVGVNRICERPVVRDGQIVVRKVMNLSSSFDHRIVDGWEAAAFIQRIKGLLEQPAILFIG